MSTTTDAQKAYARAYAKRRYAKRKAGGVCVECGKAPPVASKVRCVLCRIRMRDFSGAYYRRKQKREAAAVAPPQEPEKREEPKAPPALRLWQLLPGYDPASGTAAECAAAIQESCDLRDIRHSRCPTPAQVQERKNAFLVDRVNAKGVSFSRYATNENRNHFFQLRRFAQSDRGERYEVSAYDPVMELRFTYGWTDLPAELIWEVQRHARFTSTRVRDREPGRPYLTTERT